jgi:multidrug resistance efflux pump
MPDADANGNGQAATLPADYQAADALKLAREARKAVTELREELEARDQRIDDLQAELSAVRQELAELRDRTDLLAMVDSADDADAEVRRAALIQHLHRQAGDSGTARLDREGVETALHHPDVHRTTILQDMREAANLVESDLLRYDGGPPATITLDLSKGDLPSEYHGGGRR